MTAGVAVDEQDSQESVARFDRARVIRTLTFWLRPAFVLRVVNRFQKVVGFDRAIALASSALTAVIPLSIVTSALFTHFGGKDTAEARDRFLGVLFVDRHPRSQSPRRPPVVTSSG